VKERRQFVASGRACADTGGDDRFWHALPAWNRAGLLNSMVR
jgi:hypothetical protein